jgi:ribosomal protein S14
MLHLKTKDLKYRKKFLQREKSFLIGKFIFLYFLKNSSKSLRFLSEKFVQKYLKGSFRMKIVNRCIITNRGRGVFRPFGCSRLVLRNLFLFGIIPGFKKAVW